MKNLLFRSLLIGTAVFCTTGAQAEIMESPSERPAIPYTSPANEMTARPVPHHAPVTRVLGEVDPVPQPAASAEYPSQPSMSPAEISDDTMADQPADDDVLFNNMDDNLDGCINREEFRRFHQRMREHRRENPIPHDFRNDGRERR